MSHTNDLRLLHALQIAPRAPWSTLGTALHQSPAGLAARWQKLVDEGLAWCTLVPFGPSHTGTLVFIALLSESTRRESLCSELARMPEVLSIEEPARQWDFIITVLASSLDEFLRKTRPRLAALPGVLRHETIICTNVRVRGDQWRLQALDQQTVSALQHCAPAKDPQPKELREEDIDLIAELFHNGRVGTIEIANQKAIHPSSVSRRLNRLLAHPRLSLRCDLAPELISQALSCQWFCWLPPNQHAAAAAILQQVSGLHFCSSTTGQTNFTFVFWVSSPGEIFDLERIIVDRIPDLSVSEVSVTMRFIKRMGWMLDERGRRRNHPVLPRFQ